MAALLSSSLLRTGAVGTAAARQGIANAAALRHRVVVGTAYTPVVSAATSPLGALRFYSEEVHDHFRRPRNVGGLSADDPTVGTAVVGKAACGDVIKLQVKVEDGVICDAKFKTFGCGSAIASSSYATELIKGKTTDAAMGISNREISDHLNLPPVKLHCSLLAEDAVRLAIRNFEEKQRQQAGNSSSTSAAGGGEEKQQQQQQSGGQAKKAAAAAVEEAII